MKPRRVALMLEVITNLTIKEIHEDAKLGWSNIDGRVWDVLQVQVNVIKNKKKKPRGR